MGPGVTARVTDSDSAATMTVTPIRTGGDPPAGGPTGGNLSESD
jgi:hypothetical protein